MGRLQRYAQRGVAAIFFVAVLLASLATFAIGIIGLWTIGTGVLHYAEDKDKHDLITATLQGIELILIAPLPPTISAAAGWYFEGSVLNEDLRLKAEQRLGSVKGVLANLMMSVVLTDLIRRLLTDESFSELDLALAAIVLIAVSVYSWLLSRH